MADSSTYNSKRLPPSRIILEPADLRQYPAHNLVVWQPQGVLDDQLLDQIGEWACHIEKASVPFNRFLDFSRLTSVALTKGIFLHLRGSAPSKSSRSRR